MSSFEIRATDIGPIIIYEGNFVTLASDDALIELCHEDGSRFDDIQNHIKDELRRSFDDYCDGFDANINPPAAKLYAYISSYQQFWIFKNIKFAQYMQAFNEAEDEQQ